MADLEPRFNDVRVCYVARYRTHVPVGTFILFDNGASVSVGRILEIESERSIIINRFLKRSELAGQGAQLAAPPVDERCHYIQERFQTLNRESVRISDVTDIAFVFKESVIATGGITDICQGITNVFLIRLRVDGSNIPTNECLPFSNDYPHGKEDFCFPRHVWNTLLRINVEVSRILGRTNQSQSGTKRVKIGMDTIAWKYLLEKSREVGCREKQEVCLICWKRVTMPGLTIKKRVENTASDLIRFETESELNGFAGIFGERVIVNVRAHLPFSW